MTTTPLFDGASRHPADRLLRWCAIEACACETPGELLPAFAARAAELGIPLVRLNVTLRTLHPLFHAESWRWKAEQASIEMDRYAFQQTDSPTYLASPIRPLLAGELNRIRHRVVAGQAQPYPVLDQYAALGVTDYLAVALRPVHALPAIVTAMTNQPGGFTDEQIEILESGFLGLQAPFELYVQRCIARTICETWIGPQTGPLILDGHVRRGSVGSLRAVICFCDLRGFTPLTQRLGGQGVTDLLNAFFGEVAEAVHGRGGEILKFMGDAALSIFPLAADEDASARCAAALDAALDALGRLAALPVPEGAAISAGFSLHVGDVTYGNIGAPTRLDFTVIGPAVNQASRLEGLCGRLGQTVVASAAFAALCPRPLVSLGRYPLKGIEGEQEVFGLPPAAAAAFER